MTPIVSEKIKCDISCLGFPGCLSSSVKYNQLPSAVASQSYKTHNNNFYRCNYRYNLTWPWSPYTLHKCYMVFLQNFFLSSVFAFFFGKTSQVMTYHLHQWDTISYLSLESLKLNTISQNILGFRWFNSRFTVLRYSSHSLSPGN